MYFLAFSCSFENLFFIAFYILDPMENYLLVLITILVCILFLVGIISNRRVKDDVDFIVAGRKFNTFLTTFSLFATWFGAGTLITATDDISQRGLRDIVLEPVGSGLCLLIAGLFLAKKLWNLKLYTISDYFKLRYGRSAELYSVLTTIPIFVGWIAVQFVALANLLSIFFPIHTHILVVIIAFLSMSLTILGGLWSVTITDSVQMFIIILGLGIIFYKVVATHSGFFQLYQMTPAAIKTWVPTESKKDFITWLTVLSIASLGNLSGQDLMQRIFSARSAKVAQLGCIVSGILYICIGMIPVFLGIFSNVIFKNTIKQNVIATYAKEYLPQELTIVFVLCIFSAVFSTTTSAILAPSTVLSNNFLKNKFLNKSPIVLCRISVIFITGLSLLTSFLGENFYTILEKSYAIGLVSFFAPLVFGIVYKKSLDSNSGLFGMLTGLLVWLSGFIISYDYPVEIYAVVSNFLVLLFVQVTFHRVSISE